MGKIVDVYGKKLFSLALIFNALLTVVFAIGLLASYYTLFPTWMPYPPYILNGQLFWILIPAALYNIFPSVNIGKVHTGRLWFHHYVYGFIVAGLALILTAVFGQGGILSMFTIYTTDVGVNTERFFLLGGLTLVIDDLPDVSKGLKSGFKSLKSSAQQHGKLLHAVQVVMGFLALYFFLAISIYIPQHSDEATLANLILLGTLFITVVTAFANVKRKVWLKIEASNDLSDKH
jgi:uncharacterized membrane protein